MHSSVVRSPWCVGGQSQARAPNRAESQPSLTTHAYRSSAAEQAKVRSVLDEFSRPNLEAYWPFAAKDGNREVHYRAGHVGSTAVTFLPSVPPLLREFRAAVDSALPGMYCWFDDSSLHMTIRALE